MRRATPSALCALTLAAGPWAWAQAASPAPEVLTIEQAVALALGNNRRVAMAAMEVERAEHRVNAARTRRLPSLDLDIMAGTTLNPIRVTFPEGAFGTFPDIGPIPGRDTVVEAPRAVSGNVSATLAQPLTQLHRIGLGTKLSRLARDVEKEKLRSARAQVAAETRRLYYALLHGQAALAAAEDQVEVYREADRTVAVHVAHETVLASDGMDVKARLAAAEYDVLRLRNELDGRREHMNHLLGRDLDHPFEVSGVPEPTAAELDLPAALARAAERRPDLAQARLTVEQADTDRRMKQAESIPDVSLALTYTSFVNVDLLPSNVAQLGVQLTWEPFDWGRRRRERAEKLLALQQARSAAREASSQARLEVAQRFRSLREARLLLEAARLSRAAFQERLRVVTVRHREEAALLRDLLQAQAAASEADARWSEALMALCTAQVEFQKSIGEDE
jgi:outer membrane protein TolC